MSSHLHDTPLSRLLPQSISDDSGVSAAAQALDPLLRILSKSIPNALLYARLFGQKPSGMLAPLRRLTTFAGGLKTLDTDLLEQLAWQWHVDFRETAASDAVLAEMVRKSISWHRAKGTPSSIRAALALFGYEAVIEENGPGDHWATYQLGLPGIVGESDVRRIVAVAREMAPARCRLWRIYAGFDRRPIVPSVGPSLGDGWLSFHSGSSVDVGGGDTTLVSFGTSSRHGTGRVYPEAKCVGTGGVAAMGTECPYIDTFVLSRSKIGDAFPMNHGFTTGQVVSLLWGANVRQWVGGWTGNWSDAVTTAWDRFLPEWRMGRKRRYARSQLVLSVPESASDAGTETGTAFSIGTLGDINARLGRTHAVTFDGWGKLSESSLSETDVNRQDAELTVMTRSRLSLSTSAVFTADTPSASSGARGFSGCSAPLRHETDWGGRTWGSDSWWPYQAQARISTSST